MTTSHPAALHAVIAAALAGAPVQRWRPVTGGDIAQAFELVTPAGRRFLKLLPATAADRLASEADGLRALAATGAIRVPAVLGQGSDADSGWLLLEWLDLGRRHAAADAALGDSLAALHTHQGESHGWSDDNFIGLTFQSNTCHRDWIRFFTDQRLGLQLELLARTDNPEWGRWLDPMRRAFSTDLDGHMPPPALLHGDLWSGNAAALTDGTPVVFDPAVHYGDRECDLAMADLFGGFSSGFWQAYTRAAPLSLGWQRRRRWYQLYHILNHANLFGGHYRQRARDELASLCG